MRIAFEVDEAIGMFPTSPAQPGASGGGPGGFVEKSYTHINFMVDGGQAGAELEGYRLRSVGVSSPPLPTRIQVEARLAALRKAMGKPDRTGPPSDEPGALRYAWSNAENSLSVHTVRTAEGWLVSERYQRLPFDKL